MSIDLMAAMPTHSGFMNAQGAQNLFELQRLVLDRGGRFTFEFQSGATISLVRNAIVASFLESTADALFMLDSDQIIAAGAVARMIDFGRPVVGAIYPKRLYNWSKMAPAQDASPNQLVYRAMAFVGALEADGNGQAEMIEGFCRAEHLGTGIMLIRREAFEHLKITYPDLRNKGFGEDAYPELGDTERWGFFNPIDQQNGIPLSEDISFCRRWRAAGGELWADVTASTAHVGNHPFTGNYLDYLEAMRAR